MGKIIAIANQKGGVGKTTTAVNLSAALALTGRRILMIDCDPQANATSGLGVSAENGASLYEALIGGASITDVIQPTEIDVLSVIPSSPALIGAEVELLDEIGREQILRGALRPVIDDYDYLILDCPPSLGMMTINALTASEAVIIPLQCEYYGLEGISRLVTTIERIHERLNPRLRLAGVLLTMYDSRTNLAAQVAAEVRRHFGDKVFRTIVPRNVRLGEAPSHGLPVAIYDPRCAGAIAYQNLAEEFIANEEKSAG